MAGGHCRVSVPTPLPIFIGTVSGESSDRQRGGVSSGAGQASRIQYQVGFGVDKAHAPDLTPPQTNTPSPFFGFCVFFLPPPIARARDGPVCDGADSQALVWRLGPILGDKLHLTKDEIKGDTGYKVCIIGT